MKILDGGPFWIFNRGCGCVVLDRPSIPKHMAGALWMIVVQPCLEHKANGSS